MEGSEGAGPERSPQGQPACHFLICWADFLSPEGEGAGRVGGCLLIGPRAEAGGAVGPRLGSAGRAGAGAGRLIPGQEARPAPTPHLFPLHLSACCCQVARPGRAAGVAPCFSLTFSPWMTSFWVLW